MFVTVGQLRAAMIKQVRMVNNVFDLLDHLSLPAWPQVSVHELVILEQVLTMLGVSILNRWNIKPAEERKCWKTLIKNIRYYIKIKRFQRPWQIYSLLTPFYDGLHVHSQLELVVKDRAEISVRLQDLYVHAVNTPALYLVLQHLKSMISSFVVDTVMCR